MFRIAARQIPRRARLEPVVSRIARLDIHSSRPHIEQQERADRRRLVPALRAMNDERALDVEPGERLRHELRHIAAVRADHMQRRLRRIRERPEHIEHRAHAERRAHRRDGLHRRVIVRREQEREVRGREAGAGGLLVQRNLQPEHFEHVGRAGAARHRAVAVLHDRQPARRGEHRRARRNVHAARGIAARADDVDGTSIRRNVGPARQRAHGAREAAQLVRHHAFAAQRREHGARHVRRACPRFVSCAEQLLRLRLREVAALEQLFEQLTQKRHARLRGPLRRGVRRRRMRKFAMSVGTIRRQHALGMELHAFDHERLRWRTPMISPSGVRAVTSSTGGNVSGCAISE